MQIPHFRFVLPNFGPAFWSNVHPISFASGEGGMEVIDGCEKDGSRSLKTSHLGHGFDDSYISLTSSHILRCGLNGVSHNTLYTSI